MNHSHIVRSRHGFTLIELLLVIAIILVLAGVIAVALSPTQRLQQARDRVREQDTEEIISAFALYELEHEGAYPSFVQQLVDGDVYMISGSDGSSDPCAIQADVCKTPVTSDSHCVDISSLVEDGYLTEVPVSPLVEFQWGGDAGSGYTLSFDTDSHEIMIRACESESSDVEIEAAR